MALTKNEARLILGMLARGDHNHNIAAWFGVNPARVAEVKNGDFGTLEMAPSADLPPVGPPGPKGRRMREAVGKAIAVLEEGGENAVGPALTALKGAAAKFDANES